MDGWALVEKHNLPRPIRWPDATGKTIDRMFVEKLFSDRWYFLFTDGSVLCFHRHVFDEDTEELSCFRPGTDTSECSREECIPEWRDYFRDLKENDFGGATDALSEWEDALRVAREQDREHRQRLEYEKLKAKFEKP